MITEVLVITATCIDNRWKKIGYIEHEKKKEKNDVFQKYERVIRVVYYSWYKLKINQLELLFLTHYRGYNMSMYPYTL